MYIRTNVMALNVLNNLYAHNNQISKSMERLSTGYRINRAADDAAGLAISENMRFQINGLNQAARNIQDGISLIQTAEGALQEIHAMIQRMGVLANQSANGTYSDSDRNKIQLEFAQLKEEISQIAGNSNFNGIKLLNGELSLPSKGLLIQAGAGADDYIIFDMPNILDAVAGITGLDISTAAGASAALDALKGTVDDVSTGRAKLGAYQNRLEHRYNSVVNMSINLSAAESRIRDADMAAEMMNLVRSQMLAQVSVSMLAQANMMPRNILKLLEAL